MTSRDTELAYAFAARCEEARTNLRAHMRSRGLHFEDGWRIHEGMRNVEGRTVIVMTPIHLKQPAPEDLECTCSIDEPGSNISSECEGGH
ncbi:MAG TPA: hypothetical protein VLJ84_07435 [Usitatibacter sp.]|nr:hypothetical protein [Usitatibacter sp.]HST01474.1 hypothetical protein [Usitatibacter sp.]